MTSFKLTISTTFHQFCYCVLLKALAEKLYRRHLKIRDMLSVLFALPPMPLEPAKRVQSHSSCSGGWSGANSVIVTYSPSYSKNFSPSIIYRVK